MSIFPLPVFEADGELPDLPAADVDVYERLESPKSIVVRYGVMKMIGEFNYDGESKPGCGSKLVARTPRGTEVVEMLTTTCENAGCAKSVTRKEVLEYIDNSGGRDYPFHTNGRILRVATIDDLNDQSALDGRKPMWVKRCKALILELDLPMKLVDVEAILGQEVLTFYYLSEERIDFRDLVRALASEFATRIEMRQVGARDEARLVADYERCGQHCCCKNFLKVLRPISMKSAKLQKTTLDPLKISGRCGRLMCCLRYEDATYAELRKNLPRRKQRVGTSEGPGIVVDTKILVQLALVQLEHDGREIAVPVEELMDPDTCPPPGSTPDVVAEDEFDPMRGMTPKEVEKRTRGGRRSQSGGSGGGTETPTEGAGEKKGRRRRRRKPKGERQDEFRERSKAADGERPATPPKPRSKPRPTGEQPTGGRPTGAPTGGAGSAGGEGGAGESAKPKKRRRRRRRPGRKPPEQES